MSFERSSLMHVKAEVGDSLVMYCMWVQKEGNRPVGLARPTGCETHTGRGFCQTDAGRGFAESGSQGSFFYLDLLCLFYFDFFFLISLK